MTEKPYTMSIAQHSSEKFRFISSRILSGNSYKEIMTHAFKNIYQDDSAAKDAFVKRCIEIVEQHLLKLCKSPLIYLIGRKAALGRFC